MAGSLYGLNLQVALLGGTINSNTLQTQLAVQENFGKFKMLMNTSSCRKILLADNLSLPILIGSEIALGYLLEDPDIIGEWAASDDFTAALFANVASAKTVLRDPIKLANWADTPANWDRIKAIENATGSVLKSQFFTSSGNWVVPSGIAAYSIWGNAGGGAGGGGQFTPYTDIYGPTGGGGGEFGVKSDYETMPVPGNITVTIGVGGVGAVATDGTNGSNTVVGSLLTLAAGNGGVRQVSGSLSGGTGGGANSGGGVSSITNLDVYSAPWQSVSCTVKGGDGGNTSGPNGLAGSANGIGTAGAGGGASNGGGGTFGAGGGSGGVANGVPANGVSGIYGGGGGGSQRSTNVGNGTGGNGGNGWVKITWLVPVA